MAVTLALGNEILRMADPGLSSEAAQQKQQAVIDNGAALEKFITTARLHGGDTRVLEKPESHSKATHIVDFPAGRSGVLHAVDTMKLGFLGIELDAGRRKTTDVIDPDTGFIIHKRLGDPIQTCEPLLTIHANKKPALDSVLSHLDQVFEIGDEPVDAPALICEKLG